MSMQCRKERKVRRCFMVVGIAVILVLGQLVGSWAAEEIGQVNLLVNPSFEEGENGEVPKAWHKNTEPAQGESIFIRAKGGKTAESKGMAILEKRGNDTRIYAKQYVKHPIKKGECYKFSVWLRSDEPITVQLIVAAKAYEKGEWKAESVTWTPTDVGSTWKKYSSSVTVEEGKESEEGFLTGDIVIYTNQPADIAVEIDDAELICEK